VQQGRREGVSLVGIADVDDLVFRCTLSGSDTARWFEIPAWMFDRAACVDAPVCVH
jgi:hypothetical protein